MAEQIMAEPPAPALRLAGPPSAAIPASPVAQGMGRGPLAYAELHCLSHFSFLRGASSPAEPGAPGQKPGYAALALTDECSVAGAVRAFEAARDCGLHLIHGSEFAWGRSGLWCWCVICRVGAISVNSLPLHAAGLQRGVSGR